MRCANSSGEIIFSFSAWFSLLVLTPSNMTQALCSSVGIKGFLMLSNVTSPLLILSRSARYSLEYGRFGSVHSVTYGRLVLIYIILFYTETTGTYLVCDMPEPVHVPMHLKASAFIPFWVLKTSRPPDSVSGLPNIVNHD